MTKAARVAAFVVSGVYVCRVAAVATLPLAEGYSTTFRNLDAQTLQAKAMELKVVGTEQVSDTYLPALVAQAVGRTCGQR